MVISIRWRQVVVSRRQWLFWMLIRTGSTMVNAGLAVMAGYRGQMVVWLAAALAGGGGRRWRRCLFWRPNAGNISLLQAALLAMKLTGMVGCNSRYVPGATGSAGQIIPTILFKVNRIGKLLSLSCSVKLLYFQTQLLQEQVVMNWGSGLPGTGKTYSIEKRIATMPTG